MSTLKIEIIKNDTVLNSKSMDYYDDKEFFTALVTLCDRLSVDVPLWTTHEERVLKKQGYFDIEIENSEVLRISSY
jgi:hypothetical protein